MMFQRTFRVTYFFIASEFVRGWWEERELHITYITPLMNTVGLFFVVVAEESITDGIDKHHANYISPMQS